MVFAVVIETEFCRLSAAPVILAKLDTVTVSFTRYAVPASELCTEALPEARIVAVVTDAVGAKLSLVIVLVAVAALAGPSNALPETELAFILG